MTELPESVAERVYLSDTALQDSTVDLSRLALPPIVRPAARLSVLDITEFYGDTTGGIRTYLRQKSVYVEARPRFHIDRLLAQVGTNAAGGIAIKLGDIQHREARRRAHNRR